MVNLTDVRKELKKLSVIALRKLRTDINEDLNEPKSPNEWKRSCKQKGCNSEECKCYVTCSYTSSEYGEAKENLLKVKNAINDELQSRE